MQAAINFATLPGSKFYKIVMPGGIYRFNATLTIGSSNQGCVIEGIGWEIDYQGAGTVIYWHNSSGVLFQIGTDIGGAEDQNVYTGPQGFEMRHLQIVSAAGTDTDIAVNSGNKYKPGTTAIKDNRGGNVMLEQVKIRQFEWGLYMVASDFSDTYNCTFNSCKVGMYVGPHSNQQSHISTEFTGCRVAIECRSVAGVAFYSPHFIQCGDATTAEGGTDSPYVRIGSTTNLTFKSVHFINPWIEEGTATFETGPKPAIFDIGLGDPTTGGVVIIDSPNFYAGTDGSGADSSIDHFIRADKCEGVVVNNPDGIGFTSLNVTHLKLQGTGSPEIKWNGKNSLSAVLTKTITTSGAPVVRTNLDQMRLIYASNTAIANGAGGTGENTILTFTLPAYSLGLNGSLVATLGWSVPSSANNKTFKVKISGNNIISGVTGTLGVLNGRWRATMVNRNSLSSQIVPGGNSIPGTSDLGTNTAAWGTFSANTATNLTMIVTIQNANSGEAATTQMEYLQIYAIG
jgi:hypothetical protein